MSSESKRCRICGEVKPLDDFHRARDMKDGRRNECRSCFREVARARYQADPQKAIDNVRRWQRENPERVAEYRRTRRTRPEVRRQERNTYYLRAHGITVDEAEARLAAQGGRCAICGDVPERMASMHLDHDHKTGGIREFLCLSCNQGIGKFRDDPALLRAAAAYLDNHADAG